MTRNKSSVVYFVQSTDGGPIKIGTTRFLEKRARQLQTIYRRPIAILAIRPGGRKEEREIHRKFHHLRIGATEQFQPAIDLMNFINRPLLASSELERRMITSNHKPGTVNFHLRVTVDLHCRLKIAAARRGETMESLCIALLEIHTPHEELTRHE